VAELYLGSDTGDCPLADTRHLQGRLLGRMEALGFALREEATLQSLTQDVLKSCEIEGVILDIEQVRSPIARRVVIACRSGSGKRFHVFLKV
jgi:hypothetical protein